MKLGGLKCLITALLGDHLTWNVPLFVFTICLTVIYFMNIKRKIKPLQPILFLIGIWLLYIVIGSPLLTISYLSFSFHMIQMSFLFFIVPPLILLGIPTNIYEKIVAIPYFKKVRKGLLTPKAALIIFAILFLLYHLPFLLTMISEYPGLQKTYLTILFILAFRMGWPLASPNPAQRLLATKRKKYLLQSSIYIMPACMMFILSALLAEMGNPFLGQMTAHLCLPAGSTMNVLPAPFNTKYDQMLAGVFMMGLHKASLMITSKLEKKC